MIGGFHREKWIWFKIVAMIKSAPYKTEFYRKFLKQDYFPCQLSKLKMCYITKRRMCYITKRRSNWILSVDHLRSWQYSKTYMSVIKLCLKCFGVLPLTFEPLQNVCHRIPPIDKSSQMKLHLVSHPCLQIHSSSSSSGSSSLCGVPRSVFIYK